MIDWIFGDTLKPWICLLFVCLSTLPATYATVACRFTGEDKTALAAVCRLRAYYSVQVACNKKGGLIFFPGQAARFMSVQRSGGFPIFLRGDPDAGREDVVNVGNGSRHAQFHKAGVPPGGRHADRRGIGTVRRRGNGPAGPFGAQGL